MKLLESCPTKLKNESKLSVMTSSVTFASINGCQNNDYYLLNNSLQLGYKDGDALKVEDVCKFDQLHYYGTQTIDEAVKTLGVK